jgi:NAD-dependent dihydropyrimidine dehydrogenase PreA subunit
MNKKAYIVHSEAPNVPIKIDSSLCKGCNRCVEVCRSDVLLPGPGKDAPPIVAFNEECWFCGCCVIECPIKGAITMEWPIHMRMGWKRKATEELFRLGMENHPPANTKPPIGY